MRFVTAIAFLTLFACATSKPAKAPAAADGQSTSENDPENIIALTLPPDWERGKSPLEGALQVPTFLVGNSKTNTTVLAMFLQELGDPPETVAEALRQVTEKNGAETGPVEKKIIKGRPTAWFRFEAEDDGVKMSEKTTVVQYLGTPAMTGVYTARWPRGDAQMEKEAQSVIDSVRLRPGTPQPMASKAASISDKEHE